MSRTFSLLFLFSLSKKFVFLFIYFLIREEVCFKMSKNNKIRRAFESTIEYRYHQTCIDWIDGFAFEFDGIDDTCVACTSLLLASLFSSTTSFIYVPFYNYIHIRVFWVNIVKFKVNLRYTNYSKIIGKLRRETEFRQWHCRNSAKKQERE